MKIAVLLDSRAVIEGGRAFLLWTALHGDLGRASTDEAEQRKGEDYMALLTPVTGRGMKMHSG